MSGGPSRSLSITLHSGLDEFCGQRKRDQQGVQFLLPPTEQASEGRCQFLRANPAKGSSPAMTTDTEKLSAAQQREQVLAVFADFAENSSDELLAYLNHCGISNDVLATAGPEGLSPIILGPYRTKHGIYDIDRVAADLLRWPPITQCITEITAAKAAKAKKRRAKR